MNQIKPSLWGAREKMACHHKEKHSGQSSNKMNVPCCLAYQNQACSKNVYPIVLNGQNLCFFRTVSGQELLISHMNGSRQWFLFHKHENGGLWKAFYSGRSFAARTTTKLLVYKGHIILKKRKGKMILHKL